MIARLFERLQQGNGSAVIEAMGLVDDDNIGTAGMTGSINKLGHRPDLSDLDFRAARIRGKQLQIR